MDVINIIPYIIPLIGIFFVVNLVMGALKGTIRIGSIVLFIAILIAVEKFL